MKKPIKPDCLNQWTTDKAVLEIQRNYYGELKKWEESPKPQWIDKVSELVPDPLVKLGEGWFIRLSQFERGEYGQPNRIGERKKKSVG